MYCVNRLNQKTAPVRQAVDTGHSPYDRPAPSRADDPRWQSPLSPPPPPELVMAVLQCWEIQEAARKEREAAEQAALDAIKLDPDKLNPTRKRRPCGKPGVPPEAA